METIQLRDEYIKLGQVLKAAGLVDSGVMAKEVILNGEVLVNGETQYQRGKKLRDGDIVEFEGTQIKICR
ncbi:MAG: RNA-binding S4 domain-containing protein [Parasporobacterium sp.]|nr:RNA-binding S4 domain-containing protein [Parasporobacterium sp.]